MTSTEITANSDPIWTRIFGGLTDTLLRFPVPVMLVALLTLFNLYWLPGTGYGRLDPIVLPVNAALTLSIGWCLALALWSEASGQRIFALALQIAGAALFLWLWDVVAVASLGQVARGVYAEAEFAARLGALSFNSGLLLAGLAIAIGLAPYLARRADGEAVWQFNHKVWVGFLAAWFGGLIFFAGVSGSLATIDVLFDAAIQRINYERAAVIAFNLVPALLWFTLIPRDFAEPAKKGADMEFTSRAVALLVKFIFSPLTHVFAAILLAYSAKVLVQGGFSEARLGQIGVIYSACVVVTALLAYPTRDAGWFMRAFWRIWPYLLIAPVVLLIAALYIRFENYGVTPPRYMSALAAVWLAALIAAFIFTRSRADIRLIPGLLAALLLVAAVGPWGATGLTVRNQAAILERLLIKNKLMVDGSVSQKASSAGAWIWEDKQRAASTLNILHDYSGMEHIKQLFGGDTTNPTISGSKYQTAHIATATRLGIPTYEAPKPRIIENVNTEEPFGYTASQGGVETGGAVWVFGPHFVSSRNIEFHQPEYFLSSGKVLSVSLTDNAVLLRAGEKKARFDIQKLVNELTKGNDQTKNGLVVLPTEGDMRARLYLKSVIGSVKSGSGGVKVSEWSYVNFFILLDEDET